MKYARTTSVSPEKSRAEIERTLTRYGAKGFMYAWDERGAVLGFLLNGIQYRVLLRAPVREQFTTGAKGRRRSPGQVTTAFEQSVKQSWRAMALVIKAKLEAVESNISTVESEFLAWMVLPNGQTTVEWLVPQIKALVAEHKMPPMLMLGRSDDGNIVDGEVK